MNDALSQTLAKLDLQPGQCQVFQVNGYRVEIRRPTEEESDFSGMAMLEPWVAFPQGEPAMHLAVRVEPHPLPVPPDIPSDENVVP
ncbi:MAG TPA: hypothetical protein VG125_27010 [Pirellulales bacterium]|jgi:hypothetical protein|nr:hypothetical protein [Pirellulales bacterium]